MTYELEKIRKKYPKCKIYTNFGYKYQTMPIYNISMPYKMKNTTTD